jgi:Rrf2 family protein
VRTLKIPRPFLRKLLQTLNKRGILKSYRGIGGGFLLARASNRVFLVDLINIFQGSLKLNECFFKKSICPNIKICALRQKINNIEKYVFSQLSTISIATVLKKGEKIK